MSYKYFTEEEVEGLNPKLVEKLDEARTIAATPFIIASGFRPGDPRAHGRGNAVDLSCSWSVNRMKIVKALIAVGFRRIGIYDLHVHADIDPSLPQDVMWWDKSN